MVLPVVAQWVLGLAALITAAGVVWRFGRMLYRIESAMPVLLPIANQFNPLHARTLLERITDIEQALAAIKSDTGSVAQKINGTATGGAVVETSDETLEPG